MDEFAEIGSTIKVMTRNYDEAVRELTKCVDIMSALKGTTGEETTMADLFNDATEQKIADSLLAKTSQGESISDELNAIPFDERLSIVRKMEQTANSSASHPDLKVTTGVDSQGNEHLKDIQVKGQWSGILPGGKPFLNADVYDMNLSDKSVPVFGITDQFQFDMEIVKDVEIGGRVEQIKNEHRGQDLPGFELYEELVNMQNRR